MCVGVLAPSALKINKYTKICMVVSVAGFLSFTFMFGSGACVFKSPVALEIQYVPIPLNIPLQTCNSH